MRTSAAATTLIPRPARTLLLTLSLLLVAAAPAADAAHGVFYATFTPGVTYEDDGAVVYAPGNPFHGRENRVTEAGKLPGEGGLFLDARYGNRVGDAHLHADAFAADIMGRPNLLLPGELQTFAWYGWWNDFSDDGVIDDIHDGACPIGTYCAGDEFLWKGVASGEGDVAILEYVIPFIEVVPLAGGGGYANPERSSIGTIEDHTNRDRVTQEWIGKTSRRVADAGFLSTIQTVVIAQPRAITGYPGYDLDDPDALVDVDRYEAVNSDVESLWRLTLDLVERPDPKSVINEANRIFAEYYKTYANETVQEIVATASALVNDVLVVVEPLLDDRLPPPPPSNFPELVEWTSHGPRAWADRQILTPYAKEPNHPDDDYGGRAHYGGHGDAVGSHNTYEGYRHSYGFYVDVLSRLTACAGAHVAVPPQPVRTGGTCVTAISGGFDPLGVNLAGNVRTSPLLLTFDVIPLMWKDSNGDGHVGPVCDPEDPEEFDAERNTCSPSNPGYPYPWPHKLTAGEFSRVCAASEPLGPVILTPLDGPWPNVVVIRDHKELGRSGAATIENRTDSSPIELRWSDTCYGINAGIDTRDAILFPTGANPISIRVESAFHIDNFRDTATGIDTGAQSVRDVDELQRAL